MKKLTIYCQGTNDCCDIHDENGKEHLWENLTAKEQRSLVNAVYNVIGTLEANIKEEGVCMTRTEQITRLCEISAGLQDVQSQTKQLGIKLHQVLRSMQD